MNRRREPGEIEFWSTRFEKWIPNKKVCYVSDEDLCALEGCNRKPKQKTQSMWKKGANGKRFCSHKHARKYRWKTS